MSKTHKTRDYNILAQYGLTADQYDRKCDKQGNMCYVCGKHGSEIAKGLSLDHNHQTGTIRKFLCPRCNMLVGTHEKDPYLLVQVMNYLWEHEESE